MAYRSPAPRLPVIDEERTSSPVLSAPIVIPPIIIPDAPTQCVRPYAPYARPVMHTVMVEPAIGPLKGNMCDSIVQEESDVHAVPAVHASSRIPSCICGYTKIILGFVACPIICSTSCLAGTTYTMYHAIQCNAPTNDTLKYRDTFCTYYGCGTAYTTSYRIIESGLRDIRVQQNMSR
jgi:hypothetical protein